MDLLMVGDQEEYETALEMGWGPKDIVRPSRIQMEGRRYKHLLITWQALGLIVEKSLLDRIQVDQIVMGTEVEIISNPPLCPKTNDLVDGWYCNVCGTRNTTKAMMPRAEAMERFNEHLLAKHNIGPK